MDRPRQPSPPSAQRPDRDALLAYFAAGWETTEWLFSSVVDPADLLAQPDPLRNPLVFYLGHPAAFYVNKLHAAGLLDRTLDPVLAQRFAIGVDPHTTDELKVATVWPSLDRLAEFREAAKSSVVQVIQQLRCEGPIGWDDPAWSLLMALEHERIHVETSSVLLRQLPAEQLRRPAGWRYAPVDAAPPGFDTVAIPAQPVRLGRSHDGEGPNAYYGWDNEYGRRDVAVGAFEAARYLVTNADWCAFVRAGGYQDRGLWSQEALAWRSSVGHDGPKFWVSDPRRPHGYAYRAMFSWLDLPMAWPAEVNAHEAEAYCRWRGERWRLPTEAEHQALASGAPVDPSGAGSALNLNLTMGSPTPVDAHPDGASDAGALDVRGNVWQWLAEPMRPYDGFRAHPLYADFTAPYFDDHHALMTGGAWASTGTSYTPTYRNWFRKHFYQHAGFRMVRSLQR